MNEIYHLIFNNKYKNVEAQINFALPVNLETISVLNILGRMLCDRCLCFPSKREMQAQCDKLFGADLRYGVRIYGNYTVLMIRLECLAQAYVPTDILTQQLAFLHEIIYQPLLNEESFKEAKKLQLEAIKRKNDQPIEYAINQLLSNGAKGNSLAYSKDGDYQLVSKLCLKQIQKVYQSLFTGSIDMFLEGDFASTKARDLLKQYFPFEKKELGSVPFLLSRHEFNEIKHQREIPQTILTELYRTDTLITSEQYPAFVILNALLGGFPVSLLFEEIREKNSLCYSINSLIAPYQGGLVILTAISLDKLSKVEELIQVQLERIIAGDFSEELLATIKTMYQNSLLTYDDTSEGLLARAYENVLCDSSSKLKDVLNLIAKVTKDEVVEQAKKLQLQSRFVLEGVSNGEN